MEQQIDALVDRESIEELLEGLWLEIIVNLLGWVQRKYDH